MFCEILHRIDFLNIKNPTTLVTCRNPIRTWCHVDSNAKSLTSSISHQLPEVSAFLLPYWNI